jgi:hypothetical protein
MKKLLEIFFIVAISSFLNMFAMNIDCAGERLISQSLVNRMEQERIRAEEELRWQPIIAAEREQEIIRRNRQGIPRDEMIRGNDGRGNFGGRSVFQ